MKTTLVRQKSDFKTLCSHVTIFKCQKKSNQLYTRISQVKICKLFPIYHSIFLRIQYLIAPISTKSCLSRALESDCMQDVIDGFQIPLSMSTYSHVTLLLTQYIGRNILKIQQKNIPGKTQPIFS